MLIIVGAMIFNTFLTATGFGISLAQWISDLPLPPIMILVAILIIYVPLGCVMDSFAMIMLTLPIFFPTVSSLGFDPVWFGVLITVMMEMGLLTPPIGINAFVVHGVTNVPTGEIFRGLVPFIITMGVGVAILVAFPQISLFLPQIMK
jgi:C4-dicarboxylate transporter DctM subunit